MSFLGFILGMAIGAAGFALYRELKTPVPGVIQISHWAQQTKTPMVSVSVVSPRGSQSVYDYVANATGEARATLVGGGLAHISGLALYDLRTPEEKALGAAKLRDVFK